MKKKTIINSIVTIVGIAIIVFVFKYIKNPPTGGSSSSIDSGRLPVFTFRVFYGEEAPVIDRNITYLWNQKLFDIMDEEYENRITYKNDAMGRIFLSIDDYTSDWNTSYFALYINGTYSTVSGEHYIVNDGDVIEWMWKTI